MISLFKPYMPKQLPEMENILQSGQLAFGKWGREFEQKLCDYIGVENLMTTCNFSTAIQIAVTAINLEPGDEVIASPMSCLNSTMPLRAFGLNVVWADVDPKTGTLSPKSVEEHITEKTKLIFHNHFCGYIGYVDEINAIGKKHGIFVLDDCVEAFGSKYKGNVAGNLGTDISIFSFQTVRLPNTIDGGAVIFKDRLLYDKALIIRDQGIRRNIFRDADGEISPDCDIYMRGFAGTMSDVNSYIGCLQIEALPELLIKQKASAVRWQDKGINCSLLRDEIEPNFWVYGMLVDNKREQLRQYKADGYGCSGIHLPNNYYSVFGDQGRFSGVVDFYSKYIALPCGWWME